MSFRINQRLFARWAWTVFSAGFMGGVSSASSTFVLFQIDPATFNTDSDYNIGKVLTFASLAFGFGFITHLFSTLQSTPLNFDELFPEEKVTITGTDLKIETESTNENKPSIPDHRS